MIQSVHKAVRLLDALSLVYPECMPLVKLSELTGIGKSTCVHLLNTLIEDNLVERKGHSKYCLGIGCFYLTRSGGFEADKLSVLRPVLRWLRNKTEESVLVSVISGGEMYTIDYLEGKHFSLTREQFPMKEYIYSNSSGRILLANLQPEQLQKVLTTHGMPDSSQWKDFESRSELCKELEKIRTSAWVTSCYAAQNGYYIGCSAPLYDGGDFFAALGIATFRKEPVLRRSAEESRLTTPLIRAAKEINRRLRFDGENK